nr:hypothetical protein HmN_000010200 [Hymenolepis microstoma]
MQDLQLIWIGDLQIPNSRNGKHKTTFRVPEYHKLLNIGLLDKIVIGNSSEAGRINWTIRSVVGENIISNPHATIERKSDDSFVISDDSTHGTYVNFVRVLDKVALKESDIVHLVPIEKNEFSLSQKNVESTRVPHEVVNKTEIKSEALLRTEKRFRTVAERRAATTSPHRYNEFHFEFRRQPSSASIGVQLPSFPVELDETKRGGLSVRKKPNQKSFASANKPNKASFPKHLMRIAPKLIASLSVSEPEMSTSIAVVRTNRQNQALNYLFSRLRTKLYSKVSSANWLLG